MMKRSTLLLIAFMLLNTVAFTQASRVAGRNNASIAQKFISPVMSQAAGDTIFWIPLPGYFVDAANAPGFMIMTEDVDMLTPDPSALPAMSFDVFTSTDPLDIDTTQGDVDTAYIYGANSWFAPVGIANDWLILGPVTIPSAGAVLSWKVREIDPNYMDGYEVLATTTGGASGNFTSPPLYTVADNDPSLSDTMWSNLTINFDSVAFGGQVVWIAFHHNANNMNALLLDNILLKEATPPVLGGGNDECVGATDINSAFGQAVGTEVTIGPYSNDSATTGVQDPATGFGCFGEPDGFGTSPSLDNTLWFTFTGDGEIYFIETGTCAGVTNYIDDGDTQFALYSGSCGTLTPVACNEDGPNATGSEFPAGFTITTAPGTVYYLIVDGFNFNGALSTGEFCLKITHQPPILCGDTAITAGTQAVNDTNICFMDTLMISTSGATAPNQSGGVSGLAWVLTTVDISGSVNPIDTATYIGSFSIQNPPPPVSNIAFINDGIQLPAGTYYWTPIIFGNATDTTGGGATFISQLLLDSGCTTTGTSIMVNFLLQGDPLCTPPAPANDECSGAIDINTALGGTPGVVINMGPYDNTNATTGSQDPLAGHSCFGDLDSLGNPAPDSMQLDNTLWFTFTGDGSIYFIESGTCTGVTNYIDNGDTQFALYTGTCGSLTPDSCNEDGPPPLPANEYPAGLTIPTVNGTVYYLMVDGWRDATGAASAGQYCLLITKLTGISIAENNQSERSEIVVYPSPAQDNLRVAFVSNHNDNAVITISDNVGRTVQSNIMNTTQGHNNITLNVKALAAGAYILNVRTNDESRTMKFIKE